MGRRIVAYLVDGVLIFGFFIAVMAVTKDHAYTGAPAGACQTLRDRGVGGLCMQFGNRVYTWKGGAAVAGYAFSALLGFFDLVLLQGLTGASIGKLILGLRVVNAQGEPCGVGRAFVRWLLLIVDGACLIVGLIVSLVTHPHRRVGDMVAGTYVVALDDLGRPVQALPQQPYPYAYAQAGPPGWAPPGVSPPPAPGWGTTPPPAPGWGAPPPPPPPTAFPAPPSPPSWGAPPPATEPPSTQPPPWGAPAPAPAPPAPAQPPASPPDRSGWGAPPSPWRAPSRAPADEPTAAPSPPPPAPPSEQPPSTTPPPPEGESWWSNAVSDEDDESEK
jgi:uncharacterized RDD family membrane protein YckC